MGGAGMVYNMGIKKVLEYAGASLCFVLLLGLLVRVTLERRSMLCTQVAAIQNRQGREQGSGRR